jgi:hypothetical protein
LSGALLGYAANMSDPPLVAFTVGAVSDFQIDPGSAAAEVTFANNGTYAGTGNIEGFSGNWISPTSAAGDAYDIRMTVNSGTTPSGSTTGIWLGLGTTRTWTISRSGLGTTASNVTVEIRRVSTLAVLSDGGGAFDMTASVTA